MITAEHSKEALCRSYIIAVASAARQNLWMGDSVFDYGVDGIFKLVERRGAKLRETGYSFDFQAKASVDWTEENGVIKYDLDADAYNSLVERAGQTTSVPFYLILFCLPKDETTWSSFGDDCLTVRRCAYYLKPRGALTSNTATRRVEVPMSNALTPASVTSILHGIKDGTIQP